MAGIAVAVQLRSREVEIAKTLGEKTLARWQDVRGNHDDCAGDPPPAWGVHCVDEPWFLPAAPGLALCHHPQPRAGTHVLGGHVHPCTHVGRGFERLRLPCFHFGARVGVLPAFGAFTGMHPIEFVPGDRVFVVADNAVRELPS